MIAIIDYGVNNLSSVRNAFAFVGAKVSVTSDPAVIRGADGVVLPGIGAASAGMERIQARGLVRAIQEVASSGQPLLGICLGMQLLFERSEEGDIPCLGILPGTVRIMRGDLKIPQIGWNQVEMKARAPLWEGLPSNPYFYFVHSYVCEPSEETVVSGRTTYGTSFCSAVHAGSVWATQFHPERSGRSGLQVVRNFARYCEAERAA